MENTLLLLLESIGVNTKSALARFAGNAELYIKFLRRFPQDETFGQIETALAAGEWTQMLSAAHTLKGVSANLGMDRLYKACTDTVRLLRENDSAAAAKSYAELSAAYRDIVSVLCRWEETNK